MTLAKYGDFASAWAVFDANKSNALDEEEFRAMCQQVGYTGDFLELFNWLLDEPCCDRLTLEDLDADAAQEMRLDSSRHHQGAEKKKHLELQAEEVQARQKGTRDLEGVRRVLLERHGSTTAAWKHCLDSNGDGKISFVEFCQGLREVGYRGPVRQLWAELDNDKNGYITLAEFDPAAHKQLSEYAALVLARFAGYPEAWSQLFNREGLGRVNAEVFANCCKELGYIDPAEVGCTPEEQREASKMLYDLLLDKPLENDHWLTADDIEPYHLKRRGKASEQDLKDRLARKGL